MYAMCMRKQHQKVNTMIPRRRIESLCPAVALVLLRQFPIYTYEQVQWVDMMYFYGI